MKFEAEIDDEIIVFELEVLSRGFSVSIAGTTNSIDCVRLSPFSYSLIINGNSHYLSLTEKNGGYRITLDQRSFCVQLKDETQILLDKFGFNSTRKNGGQLISAPIPGLVKEIFVRTGDRIKPKDKLLILEAMKMENEILAPGEGTIKEIFASQGASINKGDPLIRIEGE